MHSLQMAGGSPRGAAYDLEFLVEENESSYLSTWEGVLMILHAFVDTPLDLASLKSVGIFK